MMSEIMWLSGFLLISWAIVRWSFLVADKLPVWLDEDWRNQAEDFLKFEIVAKEPNYRWWTPTYLLYSVHHRFAWIPIIGPWLDKKKTQAIFEGLSILMSFILLSLPQLDALFGLFFCGMLLCLSIIDKRTMLLPDVIVYPLLWLGILKALGAVNFLETSITGVFLGFMILFIMQQGFKLLRGKDGMGGGDVKLLAALGAWVGSAYIIPTLLLACIISIVIYVFNKIFNRKADNQFPFGPSLALAGFIFYILIPYMNV